MNNIQLQLLLVIAALAVFVDLRYNKIPNILCVVGICGGLTFHAITSSFTGLIVLGFGGIFSAGLILLPLYVMGGMAAGDVKLMATVGCILGWPISVEAALLTLVSGTFLGLAYYVLRGGSKELVQRYGYALKQLWYTGKPNLPVAAKDSVANSRFPYALAIFSGSFLAFKFKLVG